MNFDILKNRLTMIWFNSKEASFYLTLLQKWPSKISDLKKHLNFSREMCYVISKSLKKKWVIEETLEKYNRKLIAKNPSYLIDILAKEKEKVLSKENVLRSISDELSKLYSSEEKHVKVEYLPWINWIKEMYNRSLQSKENILAFTSCRDLEWVLWDFIQKYYLKRIKNKIPIKTIMPKHEISVKFKNIEKEFLREVAIVSDEYDFTTEFYVYDNVVSIASFREFFAVVIESSEIAQTFKNFYKLAWKWANMEVDKIKDKIG